MDIESYTVGARIDAPINDTPANIGVDATWNGDGAFDAIRARFGFGDPSTPNGIEGTATEPFVLLDGATRDVNLPTISAGESDEEESTRLSLGATLTGESISLSSEPDLSIKPSFSAAVGTDGRSSDATLRATLGVPENDASVTYGTDGFSAVFRQSPESLEGTRSNQSTSALNAGVLRENNDGAAAPTLTPTNSAIFKP